MKKLLAVIALITAPSASAQQVPNHAIPLGRGVGNTGLGSVAPGTSGQVLTSAGPGADPAFQAVPATTPPFLRSGPAGFPLVSNGSSSDPSYQDLTLNPTNHYLVIGKGGGGYNGVAPGSSGQVLTSNGPGADPAFQNAPPTTTGVETHIIDLSGDTTVGTTYTQILSWNVNPGMWFITAQITGKMCTGSSCSGTSYTPSMDCRILSNGTARGISVFPVNWIPSYTDTTLGVTVRADGPLTSTITVQATDANSNAMTITVECKASPFSGTAYASYASVSGATRMILMKLQ